MSELAKQIAREIKASRPNRFVADLDDGEVVAIIDRHLEPEIERLAKLAFDAVMATQNYSPLQIAANVAAVIRNNKGKTPRYRSLEEQQDLADADHDSRAPQPAKPAAPSWWCCSADYPNHDDGCANAAASVVDEGAQLRCPQCGELSPQNTHGWACQHCMFPE